MIEAVSGNGASVFAYSETGVEWVQGATPGATKRLRLGSLRAMGPQASPPVLGQCQWPLQSDGGTLSSPTQTLGVIVDWMRLRDYERCEGQLSLRQTSGGGSPDRLR